jgi:glycine betaine/choline ABC-type transport system substrate-binding protein
VTRLIACRADTGDRLARVINAVTARLDTGTLVQPNRRAEVDCVTPDAVAADRLRTRPLLTAGTR